MSPYAQYLMESLATLVAVVALSVLALVAARKLGVGKARGPMALVGSLPIDAKRSVYLVRIGSRVLIVGTGDSGLTRLGEMDPSELVTNLDGELAVIDGHAAFKKPFGTRFIRRDLERPSAPTGVPTVIDAAAKESA